MSRLHTITAGIAGAASLNLIHETARNLIPNAPHVDLLAMRALGIYILKPLGLHPELKKLRRSTMAGDLISNTLYYAAVVGASKNQDLPSIWKRAAFWGLGAGAFVAFVPSFLKLGQQPTRNFPLTASLTIAWYTIGSVAAATVYSKLSQSSARKAHQNHAPKNS